MKDKQENEVKWEEESMSPKVLLYLSVMGND